MNFLLSYFASRHNRFKLNVCFLWLSSFLHIGLSAEIQNISAAPSPFLPALTQWTNSLGLTLIKTDPDSGWGSTRMITRQQFTLFLNDHPASSPIIDWWRLKDRTWQKESISRKKWKSEGFAQDPAVGVSWQESEAYCQWLTQKEIQQGLIQKNQTYRLPTDLEWSSWVGLNLERGSNPAERNRRVNYYPWVGNSLPPEGYGNFAGREAKTDLWPKAWKTLPTKSDSFPTLAPVASFPANQLGFYDLPGNVTEWCQDLFQNNSNLRVIRGIPWYNSDEDYLIVSRRLRAAPSYREEGLGFRVALDFKSK